MTNEPPVTIGTTEAAQILGCHKATVTRWVDHGYLAAEKLPGENGPYLFRRTDVERLAAELREKAS